MATTHKSQQQIFEEVVDRLHDTSPINDTSPGSVATAFVNVISEQLRDYYYQLELMTAMGFVSTSRGKYLDQIGKLLNCTRTSGESDDSYRYRITNQVYVVEGANYTAIRLNLLTAPGINDIVSRRFVRGPGSFDCYIITNDARPADDVMARAQRIIDDTQAYGVDGRAVRPRLLSTQLRVRVILADSTSTMEAQNIRENVRQNVNRRVRNLSMGTPLYMNDVLQAVRSTHRKILDATTVHVHVNDEPQFARSISAKWNEKIELDQLDLS